MSFVLFIDLIVQYNPNAEYAVAEVRHLEKRLTSQIKMTSPLNQGYLLSHLTLKLCSSFDKTTTKELNCFSFSKFDGNTSRKHILQRTNPFTFDEISVSYALPRAKTSRPMETSRLKGRSSNLLFYRVGQ